MAHAASTSASRFTTGWFSGVPDWRVLGVPRGRLRRKHGKGKAMGVLSHKLGRTIYYMLKRGKPFDLERFVAA